MTYVLYNEKHICLNMGGEVFEHLLDLHHVDELKNFAANNLFRLVIEVTY